MTDKTRNPSTGCIYIPPAALEAGARAIKQWLAYTLDKDTRASELTDGEHAELARAAFVAMVEAWPGARVQEPHSIKWYPTVIILPLMENPDDKA